MCVIRYVCASKDKQLHLFVAVAIMRSYKKDIMDEEMEFDEILKFVNGLAMRIDCLQTLKDADLLAQTARHQTLSS